MTKIINSELLITGKIWNNETLELIDFNNSDLQKTLIKVQSSGILSRINNTITFTQGQNIGKIPFELFSINRNEENGYFYLDCIKPPNELIKVLESNSIYMVFKGYKYKNIENILEKYYKLSQGDIIKLGRIFLKVLDIHIEKENKNNIYNTDINNSKSSIFRSSSFRSVKINGQEIIHGKFSPTNKLKDNKEIILIDIFKNNDNINIFAGNHKLNYITKNEKIDFDLKKIAGMHRTYSVKENNVFFCKKQKMKNDKANSNNPELESIENLIVLPLLNNKDANEIKKVKIHKNKKPRTCRICYGTDYSIENPLISPCTCKGSMKYIHFKCLKNWLNSKIETDLSINTEIEEEVGITYCAKDLACELCKSKFPDYINHKGKIYNISFFKPKFKQFLILESIRADKFKTKFIHILSFDNNRNQISLGRSNDCELSIPELSVSRLHCFIHKYNNQLYIEDNSSKFGTCILIQNPKILITDNSPLRLVKGKTYIKLKLLIRKNIFSCCNTNLFDSKIFSYQVQNRKYCNVASSFIIKEDNLDNSDSVEENENEEKANINLKNNDYSSSRKGDFLKKNKNIKKIKIKKNKNISKELLDKNKEINKNNLLNSQMMPIIINGLSTTKNINLNINFNKNNNEYIEENTFPKKKEDEIGLLSNRVNNINKKVINSYNSKSNLLILNNNNEIDNKSKKVEESISINIIDEN